MKIRHASSMRQLNTNYLRMKQTLFTISILFTFVFTQAQTLDIEGVAYTVDTLENHQVGPGTQYTALRLTTSTKRLDVYFLKANLKHPHVEIRAALGRDSIYSGERPSALAKRISTENAYYFAGTNGDFYNTGTPYTGYPTGGNMINGEIAKIPTNWNTFLIDEAKKSEIGAANYDGNILFGTETWIINSVNHLRNTDKLVLYNHHNGKSTRTNEYGTEILIELLEGYTWGTNKSLRAKVLKKEINVGNMSIPKGKAVLSGHGIAANELNNLSVDDEIELRLNLSINGNNTSNFVQMTGGDNYAPIIKNGVVETSNFWNELHPRTGLGYSMTKDTVIFCVVDGRGVSNGCTTKVLGVIMKSAGAYNAMNMDGGGSSCMYIAEYGGPVNNGSDGSERAVANSIFVVSTAPTNNTVAKIIPYKTTVSLPRYGEYIPQFRSYNQYDVLLDGDMQGIILTCPESLGTIKDNKFIATGTTSGEITATFNGTITTKIAINLLPVSEIDIRLDSVLVDNRDDYLIEVLASTETGKVPIASDVLTWSVADENIVRIEEGKVIALRNGQTTATGTIGSATDNIKIRVENPLASVTTADSLKVSDWSLSASNWLGAQLNTEKLPIAWEHGAAVNFTHAAGRSPYITMTRKQTFYGLPDTIKFVMNIGDIAISRAIFTLKANNSTKNVTTELNTFVQSTDFSLNIPVNRVFNITDRAVYPISFDNVKFYYETSAMTEGKSYTLALKDIQLVYKDFVVSGISGKKLNNFTLFPNPVENKMLQLQLEENNSQFVYTEIYNLSGQRLMSQNHGIYQGGLLSIPVKNLSAGNYLLKVYENEKYSIKKFSVK